MYAPDYGIEWVPGSGYRVVGYKDPSKTSEFVGMSLQTAQGIKAKLESEGRVDDYPLALTAASSVSK
jgi:hypothetical protein